MALVRHGRRGGGEVLPASVFPLILGGGKRIFRDDGKLRPLRLLDHEVTSTGAILATYAPADA
jgi:hypothetical protein